MEKIQLYIPNLLDITNHQSRRNLEEIKLVGVKSNDIKYFIRNSGKVETRINQIVAEDFTVYDLQLDFESKTFTFYLENDGELSRSELLQKVFQTFAVRYNPRKVGFFLYSGGRNRPNPVLVK
ncbi:hypothetical protein [Bacillus sp. FJAT-22090]|uniref:hypothetical protein n=1 Tax=Bacillus sp. FJAT-22090 TaxID=1581038 RepID=UPI0011A4DF96|nr:hypothetical protein [Bacillus sp. FJAT-22090]